MIIYKKFAHKISLVREASPFHSAKLKQSTHVAEYARKFYETDIAIYESFYVIYLNRANNVIGFIKLSQGGTAGTVADPKIIMKYAIDLLASCVICIHNHPSGNIHPSEADIKLTQKIKNGLQLFDISLLDHVILSENEHYSFADEGMI